MALIASLLAACAADVALIWSGPADWTQFGQNVQPGAEDEERGDMGLGLGRLRGSRRRAGLLSASCSPTWTGSRPQPEQGSPRRPGDVAIRLAPSCAQ